MNDKPLLAHVWTGTQHTHEYTALFIPNAKLTSSFARTVIRFNAAEPVQLLFGEAEHIFLKKDAKGLPVLLTNSPLPVLPVLIPSRNNHGRERLQAVDRPGVRRRNGNKRKKGLLGCSAFTPLYSSSPPHPPSSAILLQPRDGPASPLRRRNRTCPSVARWRGVN